MPEVTENFVRIPVSNKTFSRIRTITISAEQGIKALVGFPEGEGGSEIMTYLFDVSKWDMAKAKKWIAEHKADAIADFVLIEKIKLLDSDALLIEKIKALPIERKNIELVDSFMTDAWIEQNDGVVFKDVVFAKEIVQKYPDGMHYKPATELKATLDSFRGKPVVAYAHPAEKVVTSMKQQAGHIVFDSVKWDNNGNRVYGDIFIKKETKNEKLIDAIKKKKLEDNSIGFRCDIVKQPGEFQGQRYDYVQKNLFIDHLALVYEGRAGTEDGVGINAF